MPLENLKTYSVKKIAMKIGMADLINKSTNSTVEFGSSENCALPYIEKHENVQYCKDDDSHYIKTNYSLENINVIKPLDYLRSIAERSFYRWMLENQNKIRDELNSVVRVSNEAELLFRGESENLINDFAKSYEYDPKNMLTSAFEKGNNVNCKSNRFDIPISMIDKARKQQQKRKLQENVLRKVRLTHMGWNQPPSDDDISDDESIQNAKRLALLRTPYFMVPIIKINHRKNYFRNKYLQKKRLRRINILLLGNKKNGVKSTQSIHRCFISKINRPTIEVIKFSENETKLKTTLTPNREKFRNTIHFNYKKMQRLYECKVILLIIKMN